VTPSGSAADPRARSRPVSRTRHRSPAGSALTVIVKGSAGADGAAVGTARAMGEVASARGEAGVSAARQLQSVSAKAAQVPTIPRRFSTTLIAIRLDDSCRGARPGPAAAGSRWSPGPRPVALPDLGWCARPHRVVWVFSAVPFVARPRSSQRSADSECHARSSRLDVVVSWGRSTHGFWIPRSAVW
jgi:hypothetical protein